MGLRGRLLFSCRRSAVRGDQIRLEGVYESGRIGRASRVDQRALALGGPFQDPRIVGVSWCRCGVERECACEGFAFTFEAGGARDEVGLEGPGHRGHGHQGDEDVSLEREALQTHRGVLDAFVGFECIVHHTPHAREELGAVVGGQDPDDRRRIAKEGSGHGTVRVEIVRDTRLARCRGSSHGLIGFYTVSKRVTASRAYPWIQVTMRAAVNVFFRRVEAGGTSNIPPDRGGLVVSWHPNGLVDPALILTQCPRPIVFGARHGLFSYPLVGQLLREVGTVPIYRASDMKDTSTDARRAANRKSLEALAERIAAGSLSALFPEGDSHDHSGLQALKTGAARLYYRARQLAPDEAPPAIILTGLHYDDKQMFRSSALVAFYAPLELPAHLDVTPEGDVDGEEVRGLSRQLTELMEDTLRDVVHATDSWDVHDLLHRARRLVRAERAHRAGDNPGKTQIGERVSGFAEVRDGYLRARERDPVATAALRARIEQYDEDLRSLRLEDYDLDAPPPVQSFKLIGLLVAQAIGVFFFLPPLVFVGYLVNLPTAGLLVAVAKVAGKRRKDEATVKLVLGMLLYPLTWLVVGVLAGLGHQQLHLGFPRIPDAPVSAGVLAAALSAIGGAAALRYWVVARETARAVRVRMTRVRATRSVAQLRRDRSRIFDALAELTESTLAEEPA